MRLAYNDSMSPVEKFRYDRNLPNAASRHALDFTNLGACRWREERVKQESKTPIRTVKASAPIDATIGYTNSVVKLEWQISEISLYAFAIKEGPAVALLSSRSGPGGCAKGIRQRVSAASTARSRKQGGSQQAYAGWLGISAAESEACNFDSSLAVSRIMSIRCWSLFCRSGMLTLSVTRYALPTRST
jgi:hypothetical protein